jgi:hypothetical protein
MRPTYLEGVQSVPQNTSEVVFTVSVLSVDVLVFGAAILMSAFGTSEFTFAVSAWSLLMVAFGVVVQLLALGIREREDAAKRRLLTKTGLVLCGLVIILTPFSLHMYWRSTWLSPLDWRFWSSEFSMGWLHLLSLALFAAIGGFIIEQGRSSTYLEGVHSKPWTTSELQLTASLMSLLGLVFGTAILLSALGTSQFMFALGVLSVLMAGFGVTILFLSLGYRQRQDVAKGRLLTTVALVLCGLMIIAAPLSLYMYWAFPPPPPYDYWVPVAMMTWYNILTLELFAAIGGVIIQRAQSTQ